MTGLRCYCCGKPIVVSEPFCLVALSAEVDRVFVMHEKSCVDLVEDAVVNIRVRGA